MSTLNIDSRPMVESPHPAVRRDRSLQTATTGPSAADILAGAIVAAAGTVNLWKIGAIRDVVPIDLTAGFLTLLILATAVAVALRRHPLPRMGPFIAFLVACVPAAIFSSASHAYGVEKLQSLFILIPALTFGSAVLINTENRRKALTTSLAALGLAIALGIEFKGSSSAVDATRIGLDDGNVIGLARVCCLGGVAFATMMLPASTWARRLTYAAGAVICLHAATLTGSRGPTIMTIAALLITVALQSRRTGHKRNMSLLPALAVIAATAWLASTQSRFAQGLGGGTDAIRSNLAAAAISLSAHHPLGIGWGDFVLYMPTNLQVEGQGWAQYPHNLVLEILMEGGLVAAAAFLYMLYRCGRTLFARARAGLPAEAALFLAAFGSSLTSSDIGGNRTTWMMFGVAFGAASHRAMRARQAPRSR